MILKEVLEQLRGEPIQTWFDLGLFIDRFKETRKVPSAEYHGFFEDFKEALAHGGLAFITFEYGIDGVTIEALKYARCFQDLLHGIPVHFIGGEFKPEGRHLFAPEYKRHPVVEINGFDKWPLYRSFFLTKLERGSPEYNSLIHQCWAEVLAITEKVGKIVEDNGINMLFLLNTNSNPGNVSLALALVFLSEYLGIPVINNSHDFYWEGGNRAIDIESRNLRRGPRDFFFTNSDVGEFFSIIEMLYPWDSRSWLQVCINRNQCRHLVEINGLNPANVALVNTAVDVSAFQSVSRQRKTRAFLQIADILGGYRERIAAYPPAKAKKLLADPEKLAPILVGAEGRRNVDFAENNVIFLQPTRIMVRKRIHVSFKLLKRLFKNADFETRFRQNSLLRITFLITGPIAAGHHPYLMQLIDRFSELLQSLPKAFRCRIYLGFLFSEFDRQRFIERYGKPLSIPEIYSIASLILLPSETEGRGLPIIEAAASGVPIFCHRYYPRRVYKEVIGTHLDEQDRLRVLEFKGKKINKKLASTVSDWIFFPQDFTEHVNHNLAAVQKRYSMESLRQSIGDFILVLYGQLKPNGYSLQRVADAIEEYRSGFAADKSLLKPLLKTEKRHYLPGYGRLAFMLLLKSLIDPSYFRIEEQRTRGMAMKFALELLGLEQLDLAPRMKTDAPDRLDRASVTRFTNAVENIFLYRQGEIDIRHDHSLAYRHRNKNRHPYQDFTFQELTGLINKLFQKILAPHPASLYEVAPHHFNDRNLALFQLTNTSHLLIDNRDRLLEALRKPVPLALFLGASIKYELDFFVLQRVRDQIGLRLDEELTEALLREHAEEVNPAYVFCPGKPMGRRPTAESLEAYILEKGDPDLRLLLSRDFLRIVRTDQWCVGIHLNQLGTTALKLLGKIKQQHGCLVAVDNHAPLMTDILDMDRFHIGRVGDQIAARIMGIPEGSGFVQYVPAGLRTTLAFPTPVQTARSFSQAMESEPYAQLLQSMGEEALHACLREDAENRGTPIAVLLDQLNRDAGADPESAVASSYVCGTYEDGMPWNGALAKADISGSENPWYFAAFTAGAGRKKVTDFVEEFEKKRGKTVQIAWNGGYILNAELVGKLGLPESYIGSPLGLVVSEGRTLCPPLFNKPAFLVFSDGRLDIRRVSCAKGFSLSDGTHTREFRLRNPESPPPNDEPCFYDLMFPEERVPSRDRVVVRLAGNRIMEVIRGVDDITVIPVGLTLSLPEKRFPKSWAKLERELEIQMHDWEEPLYAVEAGPMIVDEGQCCIDMEGEGWKTASSIKTQAARLDFLDMRGPKIAIGLDSKGDLAVLTINGRIRESVGATHKNMAEILIANGVRKAMGFDPGGSSTLYAGGAVLNISPFNSDYEREVIALPPEPRPVGNAVLGWQE